MEILKKRFFDMFTKDLGSMLTSETGGTLEFLIVNLLQASEEVYDESTHTDDKMKEDIDTLYKAGQVCLQFTPGAHSLNPSSLL